MDWDKLLNTTRLGLETKKSKDDKTRTQFERDYDRLIFSSPFRRLQNKTQVFPLPGNIFVHNRLTHSLEVASVGRSLGHIIADRLQGKGIVADENKLREIGSVVATACLAHDMGNPPFGHSGEKAIRQYFREGAGYKWKQELDERQWQDLVNYEGNANALRILTHQFKGRRKGGFNLTYTTLATIVKYPCESVAIDKDKAHQKKFGFFQTEKPTFEYLAGELGIPVSSSNSLIAERHPLVYLVEAADDICYHIIDLEDAHRLGIAGFDETKSFLKNFFDHQGLAGEQAEIEETFKTVTDPKEQIAYLRARVIGLLTNACADIFLQYHDDILNGRMKSDIIDLLPSPYDDALQAIKNFSVENIYNDRSVTEVEIAGYNVLGGLLEEFLPAVTGAADSPYKQKLNRLFPDQFRTDSTAPYDRIMSVVDFVSGMTDTYALDLFRKIKGIALPKFT